MKVKVRKIATPYTDVPTESLQAICRNHAHDKLQVHIGTKQIYDIMDELARRRQESGADPFRSNEEAWADFVAHYMPRKDVRKLRVDYLGGYDHCLVELSDVLPASCYAVEATKKYK